jgi:hypothetical protein
MKISKNITDAQSNYPEMYHVVTSNEVHSFETRDEAIEDLNEAIIAEEKIGSGFTPELIED